ncbi:MAG: YciI family protein [Armatimonadota bacterium]
MPQYLLASYLPDDFDPSTVTEATIAAIHALNREIVAAGAEKFACGLSPVSNAKTLRKQSDGRVSATDGPYIETKEHVGGLLILEAASLDEAVAWARKGVIAGGGQGAVEVREIVFYPDPTEAAE